MRLSLKRLALVVLLSIGVLSGPGYAASENAIEPVRHFYGALLHSMQNGPQLGQQGRFTALEPVITKVFDIPYMTRMAVGPVWSTLPPEKQRQLTEAFARYMTAVWADRFDSYAGEKLEVNGERRAGDTSIVGTRIVKATGEPVQIDYLMRQNGNTWQIGDVYLTGTVSELATRRSEFSSVIRSEGVDGLIQMLNRKADLTDQATPG